MTHFLQSVLVTKGKEPLFKAGIAKLEIAAGGSGIDTRLIADILEKAHIVMRKLGLDTQDTTAHELYRALIASVEYGTCENILIDSDYILLPIQDKIISLNLIDVINNAHHQLTYDQQISSHGQRSLRGELITRYMNHGRTDEMATNEIVSSMGLIDERDTWFDAWYNKYKFQRKQIHNDLEEQKR